VVYTHGGGWAAGSKEKAAAGSMRRVVEGLNAKGLCVASVQYRLWEKGGNTAMRDCVVDAKDAVRFLAKNRSRYDLDTHRVSTFGDSAGGQIAQMLLLAEPAELPGDPALAESSYQMIAGVSWYGPCDFEKTDLFNHDDRKNFRDRFGPRILYPDSEPDDKLRLYREMSPVNYLKKESPPLLMIQGDGDTTIPVKHAYYMQEKAKAVGAPVEIMIVRHAGHNWRKADGVTPIEPDVDAIVKRTVDFIATAESAQVPSFTLQTEGSGHVFE
jgi:acetyl esterase/lipase